MQVLDEIRKCYPETAIRVAEGTAQSLDLIYPNPALFTIIKELIANAIQHSEKSSQVRLDWQIQYDKFICEIDDDGPGLCGNLSTS